MFYGTGFSWLSTELLVFLATWFCELDDFVIQRSEEMLISKLKQWFFFNFQELQIKIKSLGEKMF